MKETPNEFDTVIIGGGIFGLYSALYLAKRNQKVAILEKESDVFQRASTINQARVHNGYHYPRSKDTALKAARYYQRFCRDFNKSLLEPFKQIYAISDKDSLVSVSDYINFCKNVGLPLREINPSLYFNDGTVSASFEVEEACFDFEKIKNILLKQIDLEPNIKIFCNTYPCKCRIVESKYEITVNNSLNTIIARDVVNTTYANVNEVNKLFGFPGYNLKYELCELMLCDVEGLHKTGITVMDGLFFSLMPFGDGKKYSLSSVKYTPLDKSLEAPQNSRCIDLKNAKECSTRSITWSNTKLLAKKYLKSNVKLKYLHSIFEIKPILLESEPDDSRPTIITVHNKKPNYISVLAGKISTIYDMDYALTKLT